MSDAKDDGGVGTTLSADVVGQLHGCMSRLLEAYNNASNELMVRAVAAADSVHFEPAADGTDFGGIGPLSQDLARDRGRVVKAHIKAIHDAVDAFDVVLDSDVTDWMDSSEDEQLKLIREEEKRSEQSLERIKSAVEKSGLLLADVRSMETHMASALHDNRVYKKVEQQETSRINGDHANSSRRQDPMVI